MSFDVPRIAGSQTVYNALQNAASEHTAMAAAVGEQCSKDLEPLLDGVREWRGVISVLPDLLGLQKACIEAVRLQSVQCTSIHFTVHYIYSIVSLRVHHSTFVFAYTSRILFR